jgi:putative phosphoesterase
MKIGIMADTHNHIENTLRALDLFRRHEVDRVFHCGDITTDQVVELFTGWNVVFVFGNMDRFHADLMQKAKLLIGEGAMGYYYTAEITDGVRVAVCHGDNEEQLDEFIRSGLYHYVFHGHLHKRRDEQIGDTRVINPGALGGKKVQSRSVCILDLDTGEAEFIDVEP